MRPHKKTKESGFFEGSSDSDILKMGKPNLQRTRIFTVSDEERSPAAVDLRKQTQETKPPSQKPVTNDTTVKNAQSKGMKQ